MRILVNILVIGLLNLAFNICQAQSLSSGEVFSAVSIFGDLTVQCNGPTTGFRTVVYHCEDETLSPVEFDSFVGPQNEADTVQLYSTFDNGQRSEMKTVGYKSGKSTSQINLWVTSLFQRPLLNFGLNKIDYTFKKSGQVISHGEFDVNVTNGTLRECPSGFIPSNDDNDCNTPYLVCTEYFQRYNYCR